MVLLPFTRLSPMPKRTPQEIASDSYSVICQYVIDAIEATRNPNNTPTTCVTSEQVVDCFRELRWVCHDLKAPAIQIQVWTGDGKPPESLAGDEWVVEDTGSVEDENGSDLIVHYPNGHRHLDLYTDGDRLLIDIDSTDGSWFRFDQTGENLVKNLRWRLRSWEANIRHRMLPKSCGLVPLDVTALADDQAEFSGRVVAWIESPGDSQAKMRVSGLVDRLWCRLRDGDIDSIDLNAEQRKLLEELWSCVLWAQRAIESRRTRAIEPYEVGLKDLPLRKLATQVKLVSQAAATSKAAQPSSADSVGVKKTQGKEIDKQMRKIFTNDSYAVLGKPARWWSQKLKCAESSVKDAPTWRAIMSKRMESQGRKKAVSADETKDIGLKEI